MKIPGVGWKKNGRIPVSGKNYDGIPGGERKNTGKFQGAVKVLMEFQGCTVSENGNPQQRVRTIYGKAHYMKNFTFFFVICCSMPYPYGSVYATGVWKIEIFKLA